MSKSLAAMGEKLRKLYMRKHLYMREHSEVFAGVESIEDQIKELEVRIKDQTRALAVEGRVVTTIDDPGFRVSVSFKRKKSEYDFAKARKYWDVDLLRKLTRREIDAERVKRAIEDGLLDEMTARKAMVPGEVMTPAVTIAFDPDGVDDEEGD